MAHQVTETTECKVRMAAALDDLQAALDCAPSCHGWTVKVIASLETLREIFLNHVHEAEAPGGLLVDLVDDAPRLESAVAELRHQHESVLADLSLALERIPHWDSSRLRDEARTIHKMVSEHRAQAAQLVFSAYGVDIGGRG